MNLITLSVINRMVNRVTFCSTLSLQSRRKFSSNKQMKKKEETVPQTKSTLGKFWKQVSIQQNPGILIFC